MCLLGMCRRDRGRKKKKGGGFVLVGGLQKVAPRQCTSEMASFFLDGSPDYGMMVLKTDENPFLSKQQFNLLVYTT